MKGRLRRSGATTTRVTVLFRSVLHNRRRVNGSKTITPARIRSRISLSPASSVLVRKSLCKILLRQYRFECNKQRCTASLTFEVDASSSTRVDEALSPYIVRAFGTQDVGNKRDKNPELTTLQSKAAAHEWFTQNVPTHLNQARGKTFMGQEKIPAKEKPSTARLRK